MHNYTFIKTGLGALLISGLIISCNKEQNAENINIRSGEQIGMTNGNLAEQRDALKNKAEHIIAEFNNKTTEIKTEAYKNKQSLDTDLKNKIITMEKQVVQIEDKLDVINNQSEDTWTDFSRSLEQELNNFKKNVDSLSQKING